MGYDDRYGEGDRGRERWRDDNRGEWRGGREQERGERGYGNRDDYRQANQNRGDQDRGRDDNRHFSERGHGGSDSSFSGSGGVDQGMGAYGGYRDTRGGFDDPYGAGTGSPGNLGVSSEFAGGPRFDRQDVGSTGTHGVHPVSSPYGTAQTGYAGNDYGVGGGSARNQAILDQAGQGSRQGRQQQQQQGGQSQRQFDPHYSQWRQQQIDALDRDYHEYAQENATRFSQEFGSWREKRGQQRTSMGRVTEHMEVVGSDDSHVGTVDKVKDGRIILTKSDPNAGGHHHSIPCGWLETVDDKVRLNKTAEQAMQSWRDEETNRALFEERDSGSDGPHILERSFSGTYRDEK